MEDIVSVLGQDRGPHILTAFGDDSPLSQIMHACPSKRLGMAAHGPLYSVPAIG